MVPLYLVLSGKLNAMGIVIVLVFISIVLALFFLILFIWANKKGQFEDMQGPAMRILFDDSIAEKEHKNSN